MFPLTIKFRKSFKDFLPKNADSYLNAISNELLNLKVDVVKTNNTRVDFKNKFSNWQDRTHIMASINKGYFEVDPQSNKLIYSFSLLRMFYIIAALSLAAGFFAHSIDQYFFTVALIFVWLFGVNWLITVIRLLLFFNKLTKRIKSSLAQNISSVSESQVTSQGV